MAVKIPYINPVRFQKEDTEINYTDKFPFQDNMRLREEYQRGMYPVSYYPDFLINQTIYIQVRTDTRFTTGDARITLPSGSSVNMTITDVTPTLFL